MARLTVRAYWRAEGLAASGWSDANAEWLVKAPIPDPKRREPAQFRPVAWRVSLAIALFLVLCAVVYRLGFVNGREGDGARWWPRVWRL
jgi:hypothetical protein